MLKLFTQNYWYDVILRLTFFKTLSGSYGFDRIEIDAIKKDFLRCIEKNRSLLGDVYSEFHLAWCSAILATYRACRNKNTDEKKAIELTGAAIFENMGTDNIARRVKQSLDKSADPFATIVKASKYQEEKFYGNTFSVTRPVDNANSYEALFSKCFYNNFFRLNKAPELMNIACTWDLVSWSKGIIPEKHGIRFTRPVTLGLNGQPCPFRFERITPTIF